MKKIIFFLDYDSTSGNGHLYRSLKFKKVFGSNSKIFFLCKKNKPIAIKKYEIIETFPVISALEVLPPNEKSKIKKIMI